MKTTFDLFAVKMIKFNNYSDEFRLIGTIIQNTLSYETEIRLAQTTLNILINELQKLNQDLEVSELLQSEILPGGELHFAMDTQSINNTLPLDVLIGDKAYKQIRA